MLSLGSEPEVSLATKTWMKGDERQERTEWHRVQAWPKLAEHAAGLKKGAYVRVEGELRSREYETDGGIKIPHLRDRCCLDYEPASGPAHSSF